jgi:hypothetical protein
MPDTLDLFSRSPPSSGCPRGWARVCTRSANSRSSRTTTRSRQASGGPWSRLRPARRCTRGSGLWKSFDRRRDASRSTGREPNGPLHAGTFTRGGSERPSQRPNRPEKLGQHVGRSHHHLRSVGGARQGREPGRQRVKLLGHRRRAPHTISVMTSHRLPLLYRHTWWLPGAWTALAATLAVATLRPSEQSFLLMVAILCALPWSLALLLLDLSQGFADRAALIVTTGLLTNAVLTWWFTALWRARFRDRKDVDLRDA